MHARPLVRVLVWHMLVRVQRCQRFLWRTYADKKEADKKKKKGKAKPSTEEVPKDEEKKDTKQGM